MPNRIFISKLNDKNFNFYNEYSEFMINTIFDAVLRTNKITRKTYLLLRLYILDCYNNDVEIPIITEDLITSCMQSLNTKAYKPKKHKVALFNKLKSLYPFEKEDGTNLTQILNLKTTTILTMIENNIKNNFFEYVRRYVNSYFFTLYKTDIENKTLDKKILKKELKVLKDDLIYNTLNCKVKYHPWLNENKFKILPNLLDKPVDQQNYFYDIQVRPQFYLKYMIFMCENIELSDGKMFQFFPLQNSLIPRFILTS